MTKSRKVKSVSTAQSNWLNSVTGEANFYWRAMQRSRRDLEFDWKRFDRSPSGRFFTIRRIIKDYLHKAGIRTGRSVSIEWVQANGALLWETRVMLADDVSKLLFDAALVLRMTSHRHFYFPRINFDDLVTIKSESSFDMDGLPKDYLGTPLGVFDVELREHPHAPSLRMISTKEQLGWLNSYRQYLVRRNGFDISPKLDDVVLDCGACIGDFSLLFAGMVGAKGEVHTFDPIPLHARYCNLQASLNPLIASALHINTLAVGDRTYSVHGTHTDSDRIDPGGLNIDAFSCTTLDDYATKGLDRVDFIKMDVEGAELGALIGATGVIRAFKPRLAISGYHKPEDLWEIPQKLKDLNPRYELTFGHHSPVHWESVFYAAQR